VAAKMAFSLPVSPELDAGFDKLRAYGSKVFSSLFVADGRLDGVWARHGVTPVT